MPTDDSPRVKRYHRTRRVLSVAGFAVDFLFLIVVLSTGWTIAFRVWAEKGSTHPAVALLIYLLILGLLSKGVSLPLDFVQGYWLEHRYGLSNETLGGWVKDQLKGLAVGGVLGLVALEFLYGTLRRWPEYWWLICAIAFIGFFVLLANLAPVLIFPIFFKFKPLENAALTGRLLELCRRARTRVKGVFEWKLSEKSKKANAALVGLGDTRRIILADTLLASFSEDEVEAVLAHELGHHVHRHVFQGMAMQGAATFLGFYLSDVALRRLTPYFGFRGVSDFANLPLLLLVMTGLSLVLLPLVNSNSRRMERQADEYALRAVPERSAFISSMEKLAELNLAERRPHPWIEFIFSSHPSIEKRVAFAENFRLPRDAAQEAGH
jgi:Zn-dependent protease with chaperone function